MSSVEAVRWSPSLSVQPSTDWTRPTLTGEGNRLSQSPSQMLISSVNALTDSPRTMCDQIAGHLVVEPH